MKKWSNGAKKRLTEIRTAEEGARDMAAVAEAFGKLPPGQLRKVLTEEILAILGKHGVALG